MRFGHNALDFILFFVNFITYFEPPYLLNYTT
jgi:hypothetical protein